MAEHKISEVLAKPDAALEMTLRPSLFSEFTGQNKVKERLEIAVQAARQREEPGTAADGVLLVHLGPELAVAGEHLDVVGEVQDVVVPPAPLLTNQNLANDWRARQLVDN